MNRDQRDFLGIIILKTQFLYFDIKCCGNGPSRYFIDDYEHSFFAGEEYERYVQAITIKKRILRTTDSTGQFSSPHSSPTFPKTLDSTAEPNMKIEITASTT
jgi:hypothetical protein